VLLGIAVDEELRVNPATNPDQLASLYAFMVGLLMILLAVLQGGFLDQLISGYLLTGFITGVSLLVIAEQIPALLGLHVDVKGDISAATKFARLFGTTKVSINQLIFGLCCLGTMYAFAYGKVALSKRWAPAQYIPNVLILIVLSIGVSAAFTFSDKDIALFSSFDSTFPTPRFPENMSMSVVNRAMPAIISITLCGFVESQSITRSLGLAKGYYPSADGEMFAIGTANLLSSFFGSYPAYGSLPRSTLVFATGACTTFVYIMSSGFVAIIVVSLGPMLRFLPKPTIAAIIINASIKLIDFQEIAFLLSMRCPGDIIMFLSTLCITFFVQISSGILLCLLLSALLILRKSLKIDVVVLGHVKRDQAIYVSVILFSVCFLRVFLPRKLKPKIPYVSTGGHQRAPRSNVAGQYPHPVHPRSSNVLQCWPAGTHGASHGQTRHGPRSA
jgi:MFS superfamily sulfate permease-like transporter